MHDEIAQNGKQCKRNVVEGGKPIYISILEKETEHKEEEKYDETNQF